MTSVFAHRGSTGPARANTVAAFVEARRLGADGVELDVHLSADGALVVHHDAVIPGVGPVSGLMVRQLPAEVPLLADALEACEGMVVNVELKADHPEGLAAAAADALDELGWTDRVIVSSFDPRLLADVRLADPRLRAGRLFHPAADARVGLTETMASGFQAVHPFVTQVDAAFVSAAHDAGLAVNVWTVNAPQDLQAMVDLQVDAVITDRVLDALAAVSPH